MGRADARTLLSKVFCRRHAEPPVKQPVPINKSRESPINSALPSLRSLRCEQLNSGNMDAPLLHSIENITHPAQYQALRRFYAGPAAGFKIYLDDACGLPSDWKATWDQPRQWGLTGNKNWATKYGAAGFIPHMIEASDDGMMG